MQRQWFSSVFVLVATAQAQMTTTTATTSHALNATYEIMNAVAVHEYIWHKMRSALLDMDKRHKASCDEFDKVSAKVTETNVLEKYQEAYGDAKDTFLNKNNGSRVAAASCASQQLADLQTFVSGTNGTLQRIREYVRDRRPSIEANLTTTRQVGEERLKGLRHDASQCGRDADLATLHCLNALVDVSVPVMHQTIRETKEAVVCSYETIEYNMCLVQDLVDDIAYRRARLLSEFKSCFEKELEKQ